VFISWCRHITIRCRKIPICTHTPKRVYRPRAGDTTESRKATLTRVSRMNGIKPDRRCQRPRVTYCADENGPSNSGAMGSTTSVPLGRESGSTSTTSSGSAHARLRICRKQKRPQVSPCGRSCLLSRGGAMTRKRQNPEQPIRVRVSVPIDLTTHARLSALAALLQRDKGELAASFIHEGLRGRIRVSHQQERSAVDTDDCGVPSRGEGSASAA
jgi:hypothetical protein